MFCIKCGAQIPEGYKFCARCGAPVFESNQHNNSGAGNFHNNSSGSSNFKNYNDYSDNSTTVIANQNVPRKEDSDSSRNAGTYDNRQYSGGSYGSQGYNNQSYNGQGYSNQNYNGQGYSNQSYNGQSYGYQNYNGQSYSNQSYNGQSYDIHYRDSDTNKKTGSGKRHVLIGAGAVVVLALAVILTVNFLVPLIGNKPIYLYLHDGSYEFTNKLNGDKPTELSSYGSDTDRDQSVRFSEDGKYLYFVTEIDDSTETGTLNRIACGKLSSSQEKNDKNIVEVDTNVRPGYSILDNGNIIYLNGNNVLYYYNGKDEKKIAKDVSDFFTDGTDRVIYVSDKALYGCDLKDGSTKSEKLESNYEYIVNFEDYSLDHFYYVKKEEETNAALYSTGIDKDANKIDDYVTILYTDKGFMYTAPNGETISLYDLVDDDLDEAGDAPDKTDLVSELKNEDNAFPLSNLYYCNGREIETVHNDIASVSYSDNVVIFNTEDCLGDHPKLSEISTIDEVKMVCALDYSKQNYIVSRNDRTSRQLSEKAADVLDSAVANGDYRLYMGGDYLYLNNSDHELLYASMDDEEVGKFKNAADDASIIIPTDSDKTYFITNQHEDGEASYADLYECSGDETECIAKEIICDQTEFYNDTALVHTGSDDAGYELSVAKDGETEVISNNITSHIFIDSSKILYITDQELYVYDGEDSESLEEDVSLVWASNSKDPDSTLYIPES